MSYPDPDQPEDRTPAPPGGWIPLPEPAPPLGPQGPEPGGPYGYGQPAHGIPPRASVPLVHKPKSNLLSAILVTLLCCLPFGIVAIVYAAQVDTKWHAGDWHGAERASRAAKNWALAGVVCGILFSIVYVMIVLASGTSTTTTRY